MEYEWLTTAPHPWKRSHTHGADQGQVGWRLHAVPMGTAEKHAAALCGVRPRHGWALDMFIDAKCKRCEAKIPKDPPPVVIPARYAKGQMAVRCPSNDGFKTRAARLAEYLKGRYSNREKAYIMSQSKARKLLELFAEGRDASLLHGELY